jgi:choline-glycine betaine transporter
MGAGSGKLLDQQNEILYHFSAIPVVVTTQASQGASIGASRSEWGISAWLVAAVMALSLCLLAVALVRARKRSRST